MVVSFNFRRAGDSVFSSPKKRMADANPVRYSLDALLLAGTPLTLVHWLRNQAQDFRDGARFTHGDPKGTSGVATCVAGRLPGPK